MLQLIFFLLVSVLADKDCYDKKCPDNSSGYVDCDNSRNYCSTDYPYCIYNYVGDRRSAGVNCPGTPSQYVCSHDNETGVASCIPRTGLDCYNTICYGSDVYTAWSVPCNQTNNEYCSTSYYGKPVCITVDRVTYHSYQYGVNCSDPAHSVCNWDSETRHAFCNPRPRWDCYDQKCWGSGDYSGIYTDCNQTHEHCSQRQLTTGNGYPYCLTSPTHHSYQNGINCSFWDGQCNWDEFTGAAFCHRPTGWDCDDQSCQGQGRYSDVFIECNSTQHYCSVKSNNYPECITALPPPSNSRNGIDCAYDYRCSWHKNGIAFCSYNGDEGGGLSSMVITVLSVGGVMIGLALVAGFCRYVHDCRRGASHCELNNQRAAVTGNPGIPETREVTGNPAIPETRQVTGTDRVAPNGELCSSPPPAYQEQDAAPVPLSEEEPPTYAECLGNSEWEDK